MAKTKIKNKKTPAKKAIKKSPNKGKRKPPVVQIVDIDPLGSFLTPYQCNLGYKCVEGYSSKSYGVLSRLKDVISYRFFTVYDAVSDFLVKDAGRYMATVLAFLVCYALGFYTGHVIKLK